MSRILRRPMFRGGKVSSYGTGIASGLGYESGGRVAPDGRIKFNVAGLVSPGMATEYARGQGTITRPQNYSRPIGPPRGGLSGGNIYTRALAQARNLPYVGRFAVPVLGSTLSTMGAAAATGAGLGALTDYVVRSTSTPEEYRRIQEMSESGVFDETSTGEDIAAAQEYIQEGSKIGVTPGFFPRGGREKFYKDRGLDPETGLPVDDIDTVAGEGLPGETKKGEVGNVIDTLMKSTKEKIEDSTKTEEPVVSAKQMVEDNKKLFAEMLGTEKMRRRYGEDVLAELSKGFLEGEGFRGALKRAVDVKSDEPKIDQQAAILAINDYIAGKRSKESLDQMLGKIDYTIKKQLEATQLTGNWLSDLRKVADRYRGQEGISDVKVIKDTLFETTGVNPQVSSFPKKNFKDIDTKELAVGINIVIAKDGRKIIAKNESGEIQDLSRQYPI